MGVYRLFRDACEYNVRTTMRDREGTYVGIEIYESDDETDLGPECDEKCEPETAIATDVIDPSTTRLSPLSQHGLPVQKESKNGSYNGSPGEQRDMNCEEDPSGEDNQEVGVYWVAQNKYNINMTAWIGKRH